MERLLGGTYDRGESELRREFGRFWKSEWKEKKKGGERWEKVESGGEWREKVES